MHRVLVVGAGLVLLGCTSQKQYEAPPEELPPPTDVRGVHISIVDARPEDERHPFVGRVSLYPPSRVKPTPWWQLVHATESVVKAMREKPERVEIVVTSLRLVSREEGPLRKHSHPGNGSGDGPQPGSFLDASPVGASCAIRATVRFIYAGGAERLVEVDCLASSPSTPRVEYWGNELDESVRTAVRQYGSQLRKRLGLGVWW